MIAAWGPARTTGVRLVLLDCLLLASTLAVLAIAEVTARSGRVYASAPMGIRCDRPADAVGIWRESGVRGRVLLHFARSVAMESEPGEPTARDYLLHALDEGLVRRVYHVVPDDAWTDVASRLRANPQAVPRGDRFHLRSAGDSVVVVNRSNIPTIREPVLVTIEGDRWTHEALGSIVELVQTGLSADVIVWHASDPEHAGILAELAR